MTEILAQITTPKFCAGLVLWDDKVVEIAPILRRMRGWTRDRVRDYCQRRGWKIEVVHVLQRARS
jgi:hypothetical protein